MSELEPRPTITSESNSMTVAHSPQPQSGIPEYGSMSYTVANAAPIAVRDDASQPSKPLSATAIRVVDSIVRAKVNEAAIRRDTSEDF